MINSAWNKLGNDYNIFSDNITSGQVIYDVRIPDLNSWS